MKTKKLIKNIILVLCTALVAIAFFRCALMETEYRFLHETIEISQIQIVQLGAYSTTENRFPETVICTIYNQEDFLKDFRDVTCSYIVGTKPSSIRDNSMVIKVIYSNENYELINWIGQAKYYWGDNEELHYNHEGYYHFDEEQFKQLIKKYMSVTA